MNEMILEFESVTLPATDHYDVALSGVTFALRSGECALVEMDEERGCPPLMDAAGGVLPVEAGRIRIRGEAWDRLVPDRSATYRRGIGRVFDKQAWLSNLDVDENITLAERHHTRRPPSEIRAEAERWAQRIGLSALPATRPAWTSRHHLMLAQWVRALLGAPFLLLLERPTREVSDEECARWIDIVNEKRDAGVAVWWLTNDPRVLNNTSVAPTFRARVTGGSWEAML